MVGLRSVGGESVAEYFYQAFGILSFGLAALSVALAVPSAASAVLSTSGPPPDAAPPNGHEDEVHDQ